MDLHEVAAAWRPTPVDDACLPDDEVGRVASSLWEGEPTGSTIPPLWHWFHFTQWAPRESLGPDGHPSAGHFLPPINDRARMFAGGSCRWEQPLVYGETIERHRELHDVRVRDGRTGRLLFVTIRSTLAQRGEVRVVEDQEVVYRSGPASGRPDSIALSATAPEFEPETPSLGLVADPPLLFRMSALTANSHRIHYDADYATRVEHYPSLVVHGPLLVLHMLELVRRQTPGVSPARVDYRLRAPAFAGEPLLAIVDASDDTIANLRVASEREPRHATARISYA